MDTKGEPGSEGLTPRPDIDEFKGRVAAGEYDRLQNGAEVYESPNGIRFVIDGQGGADLIVGKDQPPKTEALEEGHTIITPARDLHQEALDRNARANEGFKPLTPMPENGKDFFAREDEIQRQARRDARHQEALDANARANEGFKPLTPMPENGKDFFARQGEIAKHAREEQEEVDITPEKTIEELQIEIQELKRKIKDF